MACCEEINPLSAFRPSCSTNTKKRGHTYFFEKKLNGETSDTDVDPYIHVCAASWFGLHFSENVKDLVPVLLCCVFFCVDLQMTI